MIVEQCGGTVWWNSDGGTVWWNSVVEEWNSVVEQWNSVVEQWNNDSVQCCETLEQ